MEHSRPLWDLVSLYGVTGYGLGYRIQTASMGVAAIAVALGIDELVLQGSTHVTTIGLAERGYYVAALAFLFVIAAQLAGAHLGTGDPPQPSISRAG